MAQEERASWKEASASTFPASSRISVAPLPASAARAFQRQELLGPLTSGLGIDLDSGSSRTSRVVSDKAPFDFKPDDVGPGNDQRPSGRPFSALLRIRVAEVPDRSVDPPSTAGWNRGHHLPLLIQNGHGHLGLVGHPEVDEGSGGGLAPRKIMFPVWPFSDRYRICSAVSVEKRWHGRTQDLLGPAPGGR